MKYNIWELPYPVLTKCVRAQLLNHNIITMFTIINDHGIRHDAVTMGIGFPLLSQRNPLQFLKPAIYIYRNIKLI